MTKPLVAMLAAFLLLLVACDNQVAPASSPPASPVVGSGGPTATSASTSPGATAVPPSTGPSGPPATPPPTPGPTATPAPTPSPTPTPPPPISEFPQSWTGTWQDPVTGGSGSLELTLSGKDAEFGGSITMDGTACLSGGILDGAYDGRDIGFVVTQRGVQMRFAGTAQNATISGTFATDCDAMDGTWTVARTSR
jgi:hypothetical protein